MPRVILFCLFSFHVILFLSFLMPLHVSADEMKFRTEFSYSSGTSKSTLKETGDTTNSDFSQFTQEYNIDLSKTIFPNLTVNGGGIFESDNIRSSSEGLFTERKSETLRPYIDLTLKGQVYDAGTGFSRTKISEQVSSLPDTRKFQDTMNAFLKWKPAELPLFRFFYDRKHNYDDARTTDSVAQMLTARASYNVSKKHPLNYTYVWNETADRLGNFKVLLETHDANAAYSHGFFSNRLILETNYKTRYRTRTFRGPDTTISSTLLPSQGIYAADSTPADGPALPAAASLIDGNLTASANIDIGWAAAGEDARNIGIDLGSGVRVDKIYLYVDRNVASAAAGALSWSVFTSPDNTDTSVWTPATVVSTSFGVFQNRFEISILSVSTRYIKVVTSPLPLTFIGSPELQNIFVTEIEASADSVSTENEKLGSYEHNLGLNLTGKPDDRTRIGYSFFYNLRDTDPSFKETSLSNSLYAQHNINKVYTIIGRLARDDGKSTLASTTTNIVTYNYSAMLKAAHLKTFEQILTYSGSQLMENSGKSESNTIFLRHNANLYSGWDAYLDNGYSWSTSISGEKSSSLSMRIGTNIVPNDKINFDIIYKATKETVKSNGKTSLLNQEFDFRSLYHPYRSLSFFVKFNIEDREDKDSAEILQNYSANWSPFPDGDLQFFFTYNETLRSADDQKETITGPSLKWNITKFAFADIFYFLTTVKSKLVETESRNFKVTLTMFF